VPFDLGCPFGRPGDAAFQHRVLQSALDLFQIQAGPVLQDFRDDEIS
jgi:hypothetical protein